MAILLILFASFIFMWFVALAGLIVLIVNMFLRDFFYTEDSSSHAIRKTGVIQTQ